MESETTQPGLILQAAAHIFQQKGYAGATMAEIAAQAGINVAVIYRHFASKEALFKALDRPDLNFPDQQEQQMRAAILWTALRLFSQKGYAAATMDEIAEAAGLSKAGVYFYFPSKQALFLAALDNPVSLQQMNAALQAQAARTGASLEEGLFQIVRTYLSFFEDEKFVTLLKVTLSEGLRDPQITRGFKEKIVQIGSENVARFLQAYLELDPEVLILKVQILFGMLLAWGLMNRLLAAPQVEAPADNLDALAREFTRQFLYGLNGSLRRSPDQETR